MPNAKTKITREQLLPAIGKKLIHITTSNGIRYFAGTTVRHVGETHLFYLTHNHTGRSEIDSIALDAIQSIEWEEVTRKSLPLRSNL